MGESFADNEQKPLSRGLFGIYVANRMGKTPAIRVLEHKELEFRLEVEGRKLVAHLDRLYERYYHNSAHLSDLVSEWIETLTLLPETATRFTFDEVAPHLMPMLQQAEFGREAEAQAGTPLVARPFLESLLVTYVVDAARTFEYVNARELSLWAHTEQDLYECALNNLRRRARDTQYGQFGEGKETLLIDRSVDGYAATRILLREYLEDWRGWVGPELLLGIPNRDLLIGFSRENPNREAIVQQLAQDGRERDHPLTGAVLVFRDGKVEEYSE